MTQPSLPAAPSRQMPQEVSDFLRAHADDYLQVARITGCTRPYPDDNTCHRCAHASRRPLVPFRLGWYCKRCAYPSDPDQWEEAS